MNTLILVLTGLLSGATALAAYIIVHRIVLKGQKEEIIKKAELEAESIKKEKIFQAKEKQGQVFQSTDDLCCLGLAFRTKVQYK